uniref:Uncharacterized protein n=1 Tax=Ascaris lumbricoides TaxID=6252 RepID=A0A0M3HPL4_ASCLU
MDDDFRTPFRTGQCRTPIEISRKECEDIKADRSNKQKDEGSEETFFTIFHITFTYKWGKLWTSSTIRKRLPQLIFC